MIQNGISTRINIFIKLNLLFSQKDGIYFHAMSPSITNCVNNILGMEGKKKFTGRPDKVIRTKEIKWIEYSLFIDTAREDVRPTNTNVIVFYYDFSKHCYFDLFNFI